jgi:hypothetical protein
LTGIFSVRDGDELVFEFAVAGQEKVRDRMRFPQEEFLKATIAALATGFEEHHGVRPVFVMEWLLDESVIQQGARALTDEISRQIVEEARLHEAPPDDRKGMDYYFRTLEIAENSE